MNTCSMPLTDGFELRFESLFQSGRALAFPCDQYGRVLLDSLSDQERHDYLFARVVVGRNYASPIVLCLH